MNWHALKEYIKYKQQAKTRHGVHSPFVFDFVENVLHNKAHIAGEDLPGRIEKYYNTKLVYLPLGKPGCLHAFKELLPSLTPNDIVIAEHIHHSPQNSKTWKKLTEHPEVKMSIDLYKVGLLLFRDEFKIKQHFILK